MTNQEYIQMMTSATETDDLNVALGMLTQLHQECDRRTQEFWNGNCTRRSIQSKKFIATVNAVRGKFGVHATYTHNNRYEVKRG
jgi:hypothetical protein